MKKFEKLDADTAERAEKAAEEITRRSKETYKKIKGYLDQAHERYAKKGTLTMDDMRKFNRLKNLEKAIAEAMEENRILTDKEIEKLLSESAKSALYVCTKAGGGGRKEKSIRAIKKEIEVEEILDETVAGRNWKERTKHLSANTAYDIITEVRKGIDQGDSFHDMAKAIKKKMGEYNGRPITIAKTETHRVIETTKFKAMESVSKQVPQLKVWRTVSDERVRDSHKAMEGQTVKLDEEFTLPSGAKTMYPGQSGIAAEDINCRCFVEYIDCKDVDFAEDLGYNIDEGIEAFDISKEELQKVKPYEKEITSDLRNIATINKSELVGLDFKFKSRKSLARKILSDAKEKSINFEEAANQITDKLRYTFVSDVEKFTDDYFRTTKEFAKKNYEVIRVKNTFKDGATYKGVNTLVKNKEGVIFELQYHTPQSLSIKENELHKLYEKQRILDKENEKTKWDILNNKMIELCKRIQNPIGVERIK